MKFEHWIQNALISFPVLHTTRGFSIFFLLSLTQNKYYDEYYTLQTSDQKIKELHYRIHQNRLVSWSLLSLAYFLLLFQPFFLACAPFKKQKRHLYIHLKQYLFFSYTIFTLSFSCANDLKKSHNFHLSFTRLWVFLN